MTNDHITSFVVLHGLPTDYLHTILLNILLPVFCKVRFRCLGSVSSRESHDACAIITSVLRDLSFLLLLTVLEYFELIPSKVGLAYAISALLLFVNADDSTA